MKSHLLLLVLAPLTALLFALPAIAQEQGAKGLEAGQVATVNGKPIMQSQIDMLVRERIAKGQQDSPELRNLLKQELINREIIYQEAVKRGLDKTPAVVQQLAMVRQGVLVAAYLQDYLRHNAPNAAALKSEYEKIKARQGEKEYHARHVLLRTEDEANDVLKRLAQGEKFEQVASEKSLDKGSKDKGGDLGWAPPGRYVKPFAEALIKLKKGETTAAPVQTRFGWHVIELQDERPFKMPTYDEAKKQLLQMMSQQTLRNAVAELRSKAKVVE